MPILHSAKIIFVHIPKTGGGTIEKTLGIYGNDNNGNLSPDHTLLYGKYKNVASQFCHPLRRIYHNLPLVFLKTA